MGSGAGAGAGAGGGGRRGGRRGSEVAQRRDVGTLQAHQRRGTHDQLPPALDGGRVGEALVGPAQIILGVLAADRNPRA